MKGLKRTLICLILTGCGGENTSTQSNTTNSSKNTITIKNIFQVVEPDKVHWIDIQEINQNSDLELIGLEANESISDKNCQLTTFDSARIAFSLKAGDYCSFQYQVQYEDQRATTHLEVFSSSAETPILPPIVKMHNLSKRMPAQFYIDTSLPDGMPEGYDLDLDSIQILNDNDEGDVSLSGTLIRYNPPPTGLPEWQRIQYKLESQDPGLDAKPLMGVIYISSVDGVNPPPQITPTNYNYFSDYQLGSGEIELNLASLNGLTIQDQHDWQLVYVSSGNDASVRLAEPDNVHNQSIIFSTSKVGEHNLTYIATNHYGASSIGHIRINAVVVEKDKNWEDIRLEFKKITTEGGIYDYTEEKYHSTPRFSDVSTILSSVDSIEENGHIIAGFTHPDQALAYCQSYGRVPTLSELKNMRAVANHESGNGTLLGTNTFSTWPKAHPYLAQDDNDSTKFYIYSFTNKLEEVYQQQQPFYLSCVDDGSFAITSLYTELDVGETLQPLALITHKKGAIIRDVRLAHSQGTNAETAISLKMLSSTQIEVWGYTKTAGTLRVAAVNEAPNEEGVHLQLNGTSMPMVINPDFASAKINDVQPSNYDLISDYPDNPDESVITITITDKYANPLAGFEPSFEFGSTDKAEVTENHFNIPERLPTSDAKGQSTFTVQTQFTNADIDQVDFPVSAIFHVSLAGNSEPPTEVELRLITMVCSTEDLSSQSKASRCIRAHGMGSGDAQKFTSSPSQSFYQFALKANKASWGITLAQAVSYSAAVNSNPKRDAALVNTSTSGMPGALSGYTDFVATDNFVIFRGHRVNANAELLAAPKAWCELLTRIGILDTNWRLLADNANVDISDTPQGIAKSLYEYIKTDGNAPENQKLYSNWHWFIRAPNQRAWVYPIGKDLSPEANDNVLNYTRLFGEEQGTVDTTDNHFGHAICQTYIE